MNRTWGAFNHSEPMSCERFKQTSMFAKLAIACDEILNAT